MNLAQRHVLFSAEVKFPTSFSLACRSPWPVGRLDAAPGRVRVERDPAEAAQDVPRARLGGAAGRHAHHSGAGGNHIAGALLLQTAGRGRRAR